MRRTTLIALLAVLLLAMQLQDAVHAFSHAGTWRHSQHEQELQPQQPVEVCTLCALLAGGSATAVSDAAAIQPLHPVGAVVPPASVAWVASPLTYYRSRAPPALL